VVQPPLSHKQSKNPDSVQPLVLAGGDFGRKAVFLAGLAVVAIGALVAASLIGSLGGSSPYKALLLLELIIVIGSSHLLLVCAGLWFVDREARWLLLATAFTVTSLFAVVQVLAGYQGSAVGTAMESGWGWARNCAVAVLVLVAVFVSSSRELSSMRVTVMSCGLLIAASALFGFVIAGSDVVSGADAALLNVVVYLVAIGRTIGVSRSGGV